MKISENTYKKPNQFQRLFSVWYRHVRVYTANFWSNSFPPFFEPLIFLAGLGMGIGMYITNMGGMPYTTFLGSGLIVTSAMFTAAFECTFGTFIRLEFEKVYDGMLGAPLSVRDIVFGEVLFAGTKGLLFSLAVWIVLLIFGIATYPLSILSIFIGFITGIVFATLSMFVTSFVRNINHFNFYMTGFISPMFFFSGVVFPLSNLPEPLRVVAEILPLTHLVRMTRMFFVNGGFSGITFLTDMLYCGVFIVIAGILAERGLRKRMIV